jgi:hypothetical protein
MFAASYCQNAKNIYANVNKAQAMITTMEAMKPMLNLGLVFGLDEVKASATLAITIEIDGKMQPAATAENVPIPMSTLSVGVMYRKNVKKLIASGPVSGIGTSSSKSSSTTSFAKSPCGATSLFEPTLLIDSIKRARPS